MTLSEYLDNSPSPAWAAANAAEMLTASGFKKTVGWPSSGENRFYLMPHSGMILAASLPEKFDLNTISFRIIGAHTDSPHLRLKPNAQSTSEGYTTLDSEIYGGALLYTWFDRPLGLAGEIFFKGNTGIESKLVRISQPIATVPSLAIHLQRGVNEDGFTPDKQGGLKAIVALPGSEISFGNFLAEIANLKTDEILSYDLSLFDTTHAEIYGAKNELLSSARLDNLVSCFAAIEAMGKIKSTTVVNVVMLFDHEEIGSVSESGAESKLAEEFLKSIKQQLKLSEHEYQSALSRSVFISADMAHGLHPNFAAKHDSDNRPRLGGGVTLKINQNRRYATSGRGQALFHDLCRTHNLKSQLYTHRNDLPCGSTIGPKISATLSVETIDVGLAMLGMHSIRETCAVSDIAHYQKFMETILST